MIDTKKATRRKIEYSTLDDVVTDAERLVAAGASTTGNWSLGQILKHVAVVMEKSLDGFGMKVAWPMRLVAQWFLLPRFLKRGMPSGFQLKGAAAKELVPDETDAAAELDRLRRVVERMKSETERAEHPFFGVLDQATSNRLNCRHAELHMSFIAEP